jgi:hypothetical protein
MVGILANWRKEYALTEFKKALQIAPASPPIHVKLAVTYVLLEREEETHVSSE